MANQITAMEYEDYSDLDDPMNPCICMECCERRGELDGPSENDDDKDD